MAKDLVYFYKGGLSSEAAMSMPISELFEWADRAIDITNRQKREANNG